MLDKSALNGVPHKCGVYFFKENLGRILYVGRANDLKQRLSSYFRGHAPSSKIGIMLQQAEMLEWQLTGQLESYLIEAKLIANHQPRFNVLLKGGRPYVYFVFSKGSASTLPKLALLRNPGTTIENSLGPFWSSKAVRTLHQILLKVLRLRSCSKKVAGGCLYYHLGQCSGSCREDFDRSAYLKRLQLAKQFFVKGPIALVEHLEEQINEQSKALDFEQAAATNLLLNNLQAHLPMLQNLAGRLQLHEQQHVWLESDDQQTLHLLTFWRQQFEHQQSWPLSLKDQDLNSAQDYFLAYYRQHPAPPTVFINFAVQEWHLMQEVLTLFSQKLQPQEVAHANFRVMLQGFGQRLGNDQKDHLEAPDFVHLAISMIQKAETQKNTLPEIIQAKLHLAKPAYTIDCFDISHHQGHAQVGACVRFTNGLLDPNGFRRYPIVDLNKPDDYASLRQVVQKRYQENLDFPDLILIDGGKGQLSAVKELWPRVEFASLAKKEERVFRPTSGAIGQPIPATLSKYGLKLDLQSGIGHILTALRDQTHNFVINYHRKLKNEIDFK